MTGRQHRRASRRDRRGVIHLPAGQVQVPAPVRANRHWPLRAAAILVSTMAVVSCAFI